MFFKYGSYQHQDGEVQLSVQHRPAVSARGNLTKSTTKWTIAGELIADSQSALRTACNALLEAYGENEHDAGLYHDDGSASCFFLSNQDSFGGVRVTSIDVPFEPGLYATFIPYTITLEADFLVTNESLLDFTETVVHRGTGGPRFVLLETLTGRPVRQQVTRHTIRSISQSGRAVGLLGYPVPSPPVSPQHEHLDQREIVRESPVNEAGDLHTYTISWSYLMEY